MSSQSPKKRYLPLLSYRTNGFYNRDLKLTMGNLDLKVPRVRFDNSFRLSAPWILSICEVVGGELVCAAEQFEQQVNEEADTEGEGESLPNSPIDEYQIWG